jgi:hypothetical protein
MRLLGIAGAATERLLTHEVDFWVAVGTLGLALATVALAFFTWRLGRRSDEQLEELRRQARLAHEANRIAQWELDAQRAPLLIEVPQHPAEGEPDPCLVEAGDGGVSVSVRARNVGPGLASIRTVRLMRHEAAVNGWARGQTSQRSVPQAERFTLSAHDDHEQTRLAVKTGSPLELEVDCQDASGKRTWIARFHMRQDRFSRAWYVARVENELTLVVESAGDDL